MPKIVFFFLVFFSRGAGTVQSFSSFTIQEIVIGTRKVPWKAFAEGSRGTETSKAGWFCGRFPRKVPGRFSRKVPRKESRFFGLFLFAEGFAEGFPWNESPEVREFAEGFCGRFCGRLCGRFAEGSQKVCAEGKQILKTCKNPPTPWGLVCGSYDSPPLSFPSPLKPKTSVIYDFRGGGGCTRGEGSNIFA